jgi:iron-sulfur cluster repair protein YtfE (RIC family)
MTDGDERDIDDGCESDEGDGGGAGDQAHAQDAIAWLRADHEAVRQMIEDFQSLLDEGAGPAQRQALAGVLCIRLDVHARLEEEILYPALRERPECGRALDEAAIEHDVARRLIAEIALLQATDALFDARVTVLGEYVLHHMDEEEDMLLPQLTEAGVALQPMGGELARRRRELLAPSGLA